MLRKELDWALKSLETSENGKAALEAQLAALQVGPLADGRTRVLVSFGTHWHTPRSALSEGTTGRPHRPA